MKRFTAVCILSIFSLISIIPVQSARAAEMKIAYINFLFVVDKYQKTQDQEAVLNARGEAKVKDRDAMVDKIRNLKNELELLSEAQKDKKQAQIDDEMKKLQDFSRDTRAELTKEAENVRREIFKEIQAVIDDYAKKNGFDIVMDSRSLVFAEEKYDVTKEILNILNSQYKKPAK